MCSLEASMTVMMAFQSPELEIVGITTVFGNSYTQAATRNALLLVNLNFPLCFEKKLNCIPTMIT